MNTAETNNLTDDLTAEGESLRLGYDDAREEFSKGYLAENLRLTVGNVTQSARLAKRSRTEFYKLLARYEIEPARFRSKVEIAV